MKAGETITRLVVLILGATLFTGCATITRGTTEAYVVETKPPGAEVRSSSGWTCITPCSVKIKRRSDFVLTIEKSGYETVNASVTSSIDGAGAAGMAGNVVIGGLIGAGIDAGTGAMHSHKPNPLVVEMLALNFSQQISSQASSNIQSFRGASRAYSPYSRVKSISASRNPGSPDSRGTTRVYLDDYDFIPQQVRPHQREVKVLGQDNEASD